MNMILLAVLFLGLVRSAGAVDFTPDMSEWYPFTAKSQTDNKILGMGDWNDKPAGAAGRIEMVGDRLVLDGKVIKLWGLNNEYADCFPPKEVGEFRAAFFAKYGFNSIRLHKYNCGPGWEGFGSPESMVNFDPEGLDRFDSFCANLKKQGLYINLSSNFTIKIGPADAPRFEAFEDFFDPEKGWNQRHPRLSTGHGAVYLSPGLQELHIEQLVKLLRHKNPYTGMTYAEDPAIAFVEIYNEDSSLFFGTNTKIQQSPIMRRYISGRFADWLKDKYETEAAWRQAWGDEVIIKSIDTLTNSHLKGLINPPSFKGDLPEENFANGVVPLGQPWFYDQVSQADLAPEFALIQRRILDTAEFMTFIQDEFNDRVVKAVRATGYSGVMLGSNWQAGSMAGHFWNLMSDRKVGIIDRHNYFGGGARGLLLRDGQPANNISELDRPGSELVSSGMQQVSDRAFMLSEWNVVQPTEWYLEGPAIIGTYGMGLQGWDVSYIFASYQDAGFARNLDDKKKFSVDTPPIMGVMPIFARMVRRGDVSESDRLAILNVSEEQLRKGMLDFKAFTDQSMDLKSFDSDKVPHQTIAAARTVVTFNEEIQPTPAFPLDDFRKDGGIVSSTGELFWSETGKPHSNFFLINTAGTQGSVGFITEKEPRGFSAMTLSREPGFGAVVVTAEGMETSLENAESALVLAMARARNTGMRYSEDGKTLEKVGKAPILLEPMKAEIVFKRDIREVRLLDHDGAPMSAKAQWQGKRLAIDGARDKTPYYQVIFD
ncbi:MAG: hypothetical protein ACLFUS_09065 [Candidatus Sumerlaeia bacterium]